MWQQVYRKEIYWLVFLVILVFRYKKIINGSQVVHNRKVFYPHKICQEEIIQNI